MQTSSVTSVLPAIAILLPLLGSLLGLPQVHTYLAERVRVGVLAALCVGTLALAISFVPGVLRGTEYGIYLFRLTPTAWLELKVDAMGALFGLTAATLWLLALVYSAGYMAGDEKLGRYWLFFMICLAWTMGVAYAGNLLTFLVFYELFSVMTYPLVIHTETPEARAAALKYIVYILIGGSLILLGIIGTFFFSGELALKVGGILSAETDRTALLVIFWCLIAGFGVKAALVPLHGWVPDAHPAAPAPFSAVLSGVMVAAGTFGIARVLFYVFGVELLSELGATQVLAGIAAFTVLFAAVLAVNQDNLKRRLAYSTISQMGYVTLGFALLGEQALVGSLVHIANHAFMKGCLFLCAGLLIKRAGIHNVSEMAGVARRMPVTMAAFTLAALGMIGTPPLSGFVSKWYLGLGMLEVDESYYLIVLLGGALLAAVYLLPIVYLAYFKAPATSAAPEAARVAAGEPAEAPAGGVSGAAAGFAEPAGVPAGNPERRREGPTSMLVPAVVAAALTIVLGVAASVPGLPLSLARKAAETIFH